MAKKNYESPKMQEVKVQITSLMAGSTCAGQNMAPGGGGCDGCE